MKRMSNGRACLAAACLWSWLTPQESPAITPTGEGITGAVLAVAGISLMAYGFKQIDVSKPEVDLSNWSWDRSAAITWWADASGNVRNTGNVALTNVRVYITYYDSSGNALGDYYGYSDWTYAGSGNIPTGGSASWSWIMSTGYSYPATGRIRAEYEYVKIYESRSLAAGWVGVAAAGVGAYLIYDAIYKSSRMKTALNRHGMELELVSDLPRLYGGFKLSKTI